MPKYNATPLLYKGFQTDRFINKLDVKEETLTEMRLARTLVRNKIKSAFTSAKSNPLFLENLNEFQRNAFLSIEPKFSPQGSLLYKTQNIPAWIPPQQLDIDDGVYLPIEAMRGAPIISKERFFDLIDSALSELAEEQGWDHVKKDTCSRLILKEDLHFDVPLYAIPKERFSDLESAMGRPTHLAALCFSEDKRYFLSEEEVYLARRDKKHWVKSDPLAIANWFLSRVVTHGEILRRVCRYVKAWRDYKWVKEGPSSIALMICVCEVFDDSPSPFKNDSEALSAVLMALPNQLNTKVINPLDEEDEIYPRDIDLHKQTEIVSVAQLSSSEIIQSLKHGVNQHSVITSLRNHLGSRIQKRPDWVLHLGTSGALSLVIRDTEASVNPRPQVNTMKGGIQNTTQKGG